MSTVSSGRPPPPPIRRRPRSGGTSSNARRRRSPGFPRTSGRRSCSVTSKGARSPRSPKRSVPGRTRRSRRSSAPSTSCVRCSGRSWRCRVVNRRDEALILYLYGEHESPEEIERELAADPELALRYETLRRELGALDALTPPEPRPGLEGRMWARVAPELARPKHRFLSGWLGWATAAAMIALFAFLVGRSFRTTPTETDVAAGLKALPAEARDRVLQAALADHLDSSQRFLLEVANGADSVDDRAADLLSANRLYRRAAERAGERRVAAVLLDLETLLT